MSQGILVHGLLENFPPRAGVFSSVGTTGAVGVARGLLPFMRGQPLWPGAHTWAKGSPIGAAGEIQWPVVPGLKFLGMVGVAFGPPNAPRSLPVPGAPAVAPGPPW